MTRQIRTINDLAQLPDEELRACLGALRSAILEARRSHAIAVRERVISAETPFHFPHFNWHPKPSLPLDAPLGLGRETPIDEIPLRTDVRKVLTARSIYCIEDLSAISEWELMAQGSIGSNTLSRLRNALAQVGLEFLPNPNQRQRAIEQSKAVLALSSEARSSALRGLRDSASVSSLGLRVSTLERALDHCHSTVGDLRKLSLDLLCESYGKREAREIYDALLLTGRPFACSVSHIELWRRGLIETKELVAPTTADTPIGELRPWLGASVDFLAARGIQTLGALRSAASRDDVRSIRGIGSAAAERISGFLGAYVVKQPYRRTPALQRN